MKNSGLIKSMHKKIQAMLSKHISDDVSVILFTIHKNKDDQKTRIGFGTNLSNDDAFNVLTEWMEQNKPEEANQPDQ